MKERITRGQLEELNLEEKDKLRNWWIPEQHDRFIVGDRFYTTAFYMDNMVCNEGTGFKKIYCLPMLSIGQCLEILEQNFDCVSICIIPKVEKRFCLHLWKNESDFETEPLMIYNENDIDALWEGVKLVLREELNQ